MANFISQSCGELQPAVCLPRGDATIWRRPKHLWTFDKPQKQATAKAAKATFSIKYLPELLINVYSYRLMMKSVSYCCGSRLFSNLVTYRVNYSYIMYRLNCTNLKECCHSDLSNPCKVGWCILNAKVDLKYCQASSALKYPSQFFLGQNNSIVVFLLPTS